MNMSRATGSLEFHEILYPYMVEEGAMSTGEIHDYLNNMISNYKGGPKRKTTRSWTMNQIAQTLRVSRWFEAVGEQREWGTYQRRTVKVYDVRTVPQVVAKIVGKQHTIQDYSRTLPSYAREEYQRQLEALRDES